MVNTTGVDDKLKDRGDAVSDQIGPVSTGFISNLLQRAYVVNSPQDIKKLHADGFLAVGASKLYQRPIAKIVNLLLVSKG